MIASHTQLLKSILEILQKICGYCMHVSGAWPLLASNSDQMYIPDPNRCFSCVQLLWLTLDIKEEHPYLGILLHESLSWSSYIGKITKLAKLHAQVFNFLKHILSYLL